MKFIKSLLIFLIIASSSFLEAKNTNPVKFAPHQITHIKDRHWHNANSGPNTSRFNQSMTVTKLHDLATKTIHNGSMRPSNNDGGKMVHEYTFKKPIGRATNGKRVNTLRVVTSQKGEIITAFPVR